MKKKVLFIGEHPYGTTGNSHMLSALLNKVDKELYDIHVFAATPGLTSYKFFEYPYTLVEGGLDIKDEFGAKQLIHTLKNNPNMDILVFVGLDVWRYIPIFEQLFQLKRTQRWSWVSIFPYDSHNLRKDWLQWIKPIDVPCVYSQYGYNLLKDHIKNIQYFRPYLYDSEQFIPYEEKKRNQIRKELFHISPNDKESFVFGFFGHNQFRKDPQRAVKAFFEVKKEYPKTLLYLHSEFTKDSGIFNLGGFAKDCGGKLGDIFAKKQGVPYSTSAIVDAFNAIDCLVNTSMQEGLSWTLLESMLCDTPVIASYNTAQMELLDGGAGISVPSTELSFVPMWTSDGISFVESRACNFEMLVGRMKDIIKDVDLRKRTATLGQKRAKLWLAGVSNINDLLSRVSIESYKIQDTPKEKAVLFAQHSSAGDVLMTTKCFKGLKERHPDIPLIYMTSPQYMDIIKGNPYIEKAIPWDDTQLGNYQFVYNPHGERIAPGHWGRNSNSILSDFYWKILMVEKGDFYIKTEDPKDKLNDSFYINELPICVVHTTGGDSHFRTYKYMGDVCEGLKNKYFTIQLGGAKDFPANADLDLRGKLTFNETAWIMERAKIAVTVDSFISHLAGAFGVSQVCLFGSGNYFVVRPEQVRGYLVCLSPDYIKYCKGLGPCSGCIKDCPIPCTGIHNPKDILKSIQEIETKLEGEG